MSDSRNDRHGAVKHRLCHLPLVKCPQVFHGAASPADDHHVNTQLLQRAYAPDNTRHCRLTLHNRRIENDLHIGIPPARDLHDVTDRRTGIRRHHAQRSDVARDRLLIFRRKHTGLFKLPLQLLKFLVEQSASVQRDLLCIELIPAVPLVDIHGSADDHLLPFRQTKRKTRAVACEHDTIHHSLWVL